MKKNTTIKPSTPTQALYFEACKLVEELRIAAKTSRRAEYVTEARRMLRSIEKHDFNRLSADISAFLQYYYYFFSHDKLRGEKYEKKWRQYSELALIEEKLTVQYAKISYQLKAVSHPSSNTKKELRQLCVEIEPYLKYQNTSISSLVYSLLIVDADINQSIENYIQICKDAIQFFERHKDERAIYYYYYLMAAMIENKNFEAAEELIERCLTKIKRGSQHYPLILFYKIILYFHSARYQEGYELFRKASRTIDKTLSEQYLIIKGYASFLIRVGYIKGENYLRLGKLVNEVLVLDKDKAGYNTNLIIIKFLYYLGQQKGKIIDNQETIDSYRRRNLTGRNNVFIKMLSKIPACRFNPLSIEKSTERDVVELRKYRMNIDVEIVPFEVLWGMVLEHLRSNNK